MKSTPPIFQKSFASVRVRGVLAVSGAVLVMAACSSGPRVIRVDEPSPTEHWMDGPSWEAWRQDHYGQMLGELVDAQQPSMGPRLLQRCRPHWAGASQEGFSSGSRPPVPCQPQR